MLPGKAIDQGRTAMLAEKANDHGRTAVFTEKSNGHGRTAMLSAEANDRWIHSFRSRSLRSINEVSGKVFTADVGGKKPCSHLGSTTD